MNTELLDSLELTLEQYAGFPKLSAELDAISFGSAVNLLAIGKSAYPMAKVATELFARKGISYEGYLLTKYGHSPQSLPHIISLEASHPLPDANSIKHSRDILGWLSSLCPEEDMVILLSGGTSALFEVPEGRQELSELNKLHDALLKSGKSIAEINEVRRQYSKVKGGKALKYIACERIYCFALSDVQFNDPEVIGSAPFYSIAEPRLQYDIVGDNNSFLRALAANLEGETVVHNRFVAQSVEDWAASLADYALSTAGKVVHLFGGEAPVKVGWNKDVAETMNLSHQGFAIGRGGRCTHLALLFAKHIAGLQGISLCAYATDGSDFLDNCGGALVDGYTCKKLQMKGIDVDRALASFDSFSALQAIGAIIPAFPHRINVNDVFILSLE